MNTRAAPPTTIKKENFGKIEMRLVKKGDRFFGMANGKIVAEGDEADETWRLLLDGNTAPSQRYFGITGARRLFLHHYPNGFASAAYRERGERGYKVAAARKLEETVPLEQAVSSKGYGEAVMSVFNATNLKSPFGKMKIRDALQSKDGNAFISAAARFTLGDDRKGALKRMEEALRPYGAANWTSVTYLPFLWRPQEHMLLKPNSTRDFAERTGHRLANAYNPSLDLRIYDCLLDMTAKTAEQIGDLQPEDNIDVQSFIWVVSGAYDGEAPRL